MLKAHQVSLGDPQALAFLKNVLEDWNCTGKSADQGEHKVKTDCSNRGETGCKWIST